MKLFKKQEVRNEVVVPQEITVAEQNEIVQQIHDEFNQCGEAMLKEARELLSKHVEDEKGKRLHMLGFTGMENSKKYVAAEEVRKIAYDRAKRIEAYAIKYPGYKFIDYENVVRICEKYGLIWGETSQYKGDIPEKNLKEIEDFYHLSGMDLSKRHIERERTYEQARSEMFWGRVPNINFEGSFSICAPISDMNMQGYRQQGVHAVIDVPDPICLFCVSGGFIIVTAWGLEAKDPDVINEIKN